MSWAPLCSIRTGDFLFPTPFRPARDPTQTSFSLVHSASRPHTRRGIAAGSDKLQLSDRIRILYIRVYCNACLLSYIKQLSLNAVVVVARHVMAMEHHKMETDV